LVTCSYRVVFLFAPNILSNSEAENEKKSFKQNVDSNFYSLLTDALFTFMFFTTCILFFWRSKTLIKSLKSNEYSEWKSLIWEQFSGGGIEFGAFMLLLLLKWPVIFSYYWYKGTEKEDKSTWAQMFMREFSPKGPSRENDEKTNPDLFFPPSHPDYPKKSSSSKTNGKKDTVTDEEWRRTFRQDMQNIGFEFDKDGEITKFPPSEVMEQYQKSERFRDLMFMADSISKDKDPIIEKQSTSSSSSSNTTTTPTPTTTSKATPAPSSKKKGKKNK